LIKKYKNDLLRLDYFSLSNYFIILSQAGQHKRTCTNFSLSPGGVGTADRVGDLRVPVFSSKL